jgi:hypothetical protein
LEIDPGHFRKSAPSTGHHKIESGCRRSAVTSAYSHLLNIREKTNKSTLAGR